MPRLLPVVTGAVATGAAGFAWGLAEANMYTVRRVALNILPPGSRSLRILHISDIHLATTQHLKLKFLRSLATLKPDLVINTGDNIADPRAVLPLMTAWSALRSTPGVFVFGSNDYFAPRMRNPLSYLLSGPSGPAREQTELPWRELKRHMERFGWHDLTHRRTTMEIKGHRIALRGTDDAHLSRDDYSLVAGPADETAELNFAVTHAPYLRLLDAMSADRMNIIFAGHTHGGQVCIPGYGALITNCDLDPKRVKGLSQHTASGHTAWLHVSAGVGTSPFAPYRFACRPEVTLLTLHPVRANQAK